MPRRYNNRQIVHHLAQGNDFGATVTSMIMQMDGLILGGGGNTANVAATRPMRLVRVAVHAGCLVVNSAGDWTLRVRVNESGSDSATFTFSMGTLPGTKTVGVPSSVFTIQAGDTYHIQADGPSRNIAVARATLEWELL